MGRYLRDLKFSRTTLVPGAMAGLNVALASIPEGMAYAMIAGVNPVYGLYTGMVTTIVASLTVSSPLTVVTLTNGLALVTADQLGALGGGVDNIVWALALSSQPTRALTSEDLLQVIQRHDPDKVER